MSAPSLTPKEVMEGSSYQAAIITVLAFAQSGWPPPDAVVELARLGAYQYEALLLEQGMPPLERR